jgi:phosphonate transport system substrate-binding protein
VRLFLILFTLFIVSNSYSQKLVLATYQYAENDRIGNIGPLSKYLSHHLGMQVEVKSYPTVHLFIEGIQKDEVDIALINTFGFLLLETSKKRYNMKPEAVLKIKDEAQDNYKTAILASKRIPVISISELSTVASNYRLGLVNIGSTSGNLIPRLKLSSIGIHSPESSFQSLEYCQNHKKAIELLLEDKIDICAVGSSEYFNLMADKEKANEVNLLWLSSEIPLGPVLIHKRIDKATGSKITDLLVDINTADPGALVAVKIGWSEAIQAEKFIRINAAYYNTFKNQFGSKKSMENILKQFAN